MTAAFDAVQRARAEVQRLRQDLRRGRSKQVTKPAEREAAVTMAKSWFLNSRPQLLHALPAASLSVEDTLFKHLVEAAGRASLRSRYTNILKSLDRELSALLARHAAELASPAAASSVVSLAPDFTPVAPDPRMRLLLDRRWLECHACVEHGLALSSLAMMGGLVEAIFLARVNRLPNLAPVYKAKAAPKDKSGTVRRLSDWSLNNFIDVAHELGWITDTQRDASALLRDYRNYIHPFKEFQEKRQLAASDVRLLWPVCQAIVLQLVRP